MIALKASLSLVGQGMQEGSSVLNLVYGTAQQQAQAFKTLLGVDDSFISAMRNGSFSAFGFNADIMETVKNLYGEGGEYDKAALESLRKEYGAAESPSAQLLVQLAAILQGYKWDDGEGDFVRMSKEEREQVQEALKVNPWDTWQQQYDQADIGKAMADIYSRGLYTIPENMSEEMMQAVYGAGYRRTNQLLAMRRRGEDTKEFEQKYKEELAAEYAASQLAAREIRGEVA